MYLSTLLSYVLHGVSVCVLALVGFVAWQWKTVLLVRNQKFDRLDQDFRERLKQIVGMLRHTYMPRVLRVWLFRVTQNTLLCELEDVLTKLPPTGLYDENGEVLEEFDDETVEKFRRFCLHSFDVFSKSPRSIVLRQARRRVTAISQSPQRQEMLQALYDLLGLKNRSNGRPPTINKLLEAGTTALQQRCNSKTYDKMRRAQERSRCNPFDEELVAKIKYGLNRKHRAKTKGEDMDEKELEKRVADILGDSEKKRKELGEIAMEHRRALEQGLCQDYARYQKIEWLWNHPLLNIGSMQREYNRVDKNTGRDRNARGNKFEAEYAVVVFDIITTRARHLYPRGSKFGYYVGAMWQVHSDSKFNKNRREECKDKPYRKQSSKSFVSVGEIDLVVFVQIPQREDVVVVAIAELKSNCFSIAAAVTQHEQKLAVTDEFRVHVSPSLTHAYLDGRTQTTPTHACNLVLSPEALFYIATLIPEHEYLIGAESSIVNYCSEEILKQEMYQQVINCKEWCRGLMQRCKEKCELHLSPERVLRELRQDDRILVFLG